MSPATTPRARRGTANMMIVDGGAPRVGNVGDLSSEIKSGDVIVLNDAATLPALLRGVTARGAFVEARLAAHAGESAFRAVLFGEGHVHLRTEDRAAAPRVRVGETLIFSGLRARVTEVDKTHERLVTLTFDLDAATLESGKSLVSARLISGKSLASARLNHEIHRVGIFIQYAYLAQPLAPWDVASVFASEPWAFEPASAGITLDFAVLARLSDRGVAIATISHAAGISSTGDASLDARLPLAEKSRVSEETCAVIRAKKRAGGRVFAVGTTVARALESAATNDERILAPRFGMTDLLLSEDHRLGVVDAILTGVHIAGESHHELLTAFQSRAVLARATAEAERAGFQTHELGDTMLVYAAMNGGARGRSSAV